MFDDVGFRFRLGIGILNYKGYHMVRFEFSERKQLIRLFGLRSSSVKATIMKYK